MGALILDASVLIGLLDTADAHHALAVDDVEQADLAGNRMLAPASAYSEALVSFARAGGKDARDAIAAMGISVTPLTAPRSPSTQPSCAPVMTASGYPTQSCSRPRVS